MKINLKTELKNHKGDNLFEPSGEKTVLRDPILLVLYNPLKGDDELSGEQKFQLYKLLKQAEGADEVDWDHDTITTVLERIGKAYDQRIVGPVYEILA